MHQEKKNGCNGNRKNMELSNLKLFSVSPAEFQRGYPFLINHTPSSFAREHKG